MDNPMKPWNVATVMAKLGFSRSGVMKLLKHRRLERFYIHGNTILITGESMDRLMRCDELDARKRPRKSEYQTLDDLKKAAAKRSRT